MKKVLWSMFLSLLFALPVHAALSPLGTTWSSDDTREVNKATPGTDKAFLGTYAQGPVGTLGSTTLAASANLPVSVGGCTAGTGVFTTPTTTAFLKTTGAISGEAYCLGSAVVPGSIENGNPIAAYNQRLTVVLVTDGGRDFIITPKTKTGFSSVTLNDANDSVTFRMVNLTDGWVIDGNNGATVN